jgi:hypothetical protein
MKTKLFLLSAVLFAVIFMTLTQVSTVRCETSGISVNGSWSSIQNAFVMMQDVYTATGAVPQADVDLLNQAIANASLAESLSASNPSQSQLFALQANSTASKVSQDLTVAKAEGLGQVQANEIALYASVAVLLALAVTIYLFGPKALWKLWLRMRGDNNVRIQQPASGKKGNGSSKSNEVANPPEEDDDKDEEPFLTMDNISKIIAALLVVVALAAVSYAYISGRPGEQFSELGVLGPNQTIGNYPSEVVSGSSVNLYVYVENDLASPAWYSVIVKLGDNSTQVNPAPVPATLALDEVLLPGENGTLPVTVTLTNVGTDQRLIFELWQFNSTTGTFQYTQLWDQLWVNVTAAPF